MLFSIIYSADFDARTDVERVAPPNVDTLKDKDGNLVWVETERIESPVRYDDESDDRDYPDVLGKDHEHRKWCAILTTSQFREFVEHLYMEAEDVQTMGGLGMPGCGYGCSPPINFNGDSDMGILNAYVCPLLDKLRASREARAIAQLRRDSADLSFNDETWERTRYCIMRAFGDWHAQQNHRIKGETACA